MNKFKIISLITSALFLYLFILLIYDPASFYKDIQLEASKSAIITARRTAMLMLGFAVLLFSARKSTHSNARQSIILATAITMLGFAFMGVFERLKGNIGSGILKAIIIEIIVSILFISFWIYNKKKN